MKRILVVEDSPTQAQQLEDLLSRDYQVTLARTAERALELIGQDGFELVLSDIVMPGMSGYELCRRIKDDADRRDIPVVLLTSLTNPMDIVRGLEAGADNYITKPYDPDHLLARIRRVTDDRRLRSKQRTSLGVNISFLGSTFSITSEKEQILDVLLSAVEDTVRTIRLLEEQQRELTEAHARLEVSARESARAARISEERARVLMQNAADAIFLLDADGTILELNAKAIALVGLDAEQMLYRPLSDFIAYEGAGLPAAVEQLGREGKGILEARVANGGALVDLSGSAAHIGGEDFLMVIAHDVTERRRAEDRVRRSERQMAEAQSIAKLGSWQILLSAGTIETTPEMDRIYGLSFRELGTDWVEAALNTIVPEQRAHVAEVLRTAMEEGMPFDLEYTIVVDGERRIIHARGGVVREDREARLRGTVQDITDRKRAEHAIAEREEMLAALFEASPVGIMVMDQDKRIRAWNRAAVEMLGYTPEEVIGGPPRHVSPEDTASMISIGDRVLAGESILNLETQRVRKDGSRIELLQSVAPLRDPSGAIVGIVGLMADITEQKRAAEALQQSEERLRHAQRMEAIGLLTGGIAHDFNNMLTAIQGGVQLLLGDRADDPELVEELREVEGAARRATDLTRQLLAFSRKQPMQPRALDVNGLIREMGRMLSRLVDERIRVTTRLADHLPAIHADPGQIEQVLMNLVVNARDAMPDGGELVIETRHDAASFADETCEQDCVVLSVVDSGSGIEPAVLERIFDPFFTTKPLGVGTGLGLSTVYGIVKQSGGRIDVASEPGSGTTFRILFPAMAEAAPEEQGALVKAAPVNGSETVLLVEDDPSVRRLASRLLARSGYCVLEAESGDEAWELVQRYREPIHLVVTDMVMPGMTGPELVERLSAHLPDLAVLFMSGYSEESVKSRSSTGKTIALLTKPFTAEDFSARVREALDGG